MAFSSTTALAMILSLISTLAISDLVQLPQDNPAQAHHSKVHALTRTQSRPGPCDKTDIKCINAVALVYVNQLRATAKKRRLTMGTESMLDVAMKHSKRMYKRAPIRKKAGKSRIFHQVLQKVSLGCRSFFLWRERRFQLYRIFPQQANRPREDVRPPVQCLP